VADRRVVAGVALTAGTAALVAPVQAAAGLAVAAALHQGPVGAWCLVLAGLTVVRGCGAVVGTALLARGVANLGRLRAHRFQTALLDDPRGDPEDLEEARTAQATALRGAAEIGGLALASLVTVAVVDPALAWIWGVALVGVALTLRPRALVGAVVVTRRTRPMPAARHLAEAPGAARSLGLVPRRRRQDQDQVEELQARRQRWQSPARWADLGAPAWGALGQVACALGAALGVAQGRLGIGAAVAVILVTTTAAARLETLPSTIQAWIRHRMALGRLRRLRICPAGTTTPVGPLSVVIGRLGQVEAGGFLHLTGSALVLADAAQALGGGGGLPVLLGNGDLRPGTRAWQQRVQVLGPTPTLVAGSLRRNLDPAGCQSPQDLEMILDEVRLNHLVPRLDQGIGPGGRELSGGEARRVALARALLAEPAVLVVVDPTRGLDPLAAKAVMQVLERREGHLTRIVLGGPALAGSDALGRSA
jgi:hypothetical protein